MTNYRSGDSAANWSLSACRNTDVSVRPPAFATTLSSVPVVRATSGRGLSSCSTCPGLNKAGVLISATPRRRTLKSGLACSEALSMRRRRGLIFGEAATRESLSPWQHETAKWQISRWWRAPVPGPGRDCSCCCCCCSCCCAAASLPLLLLTWNRTRFRATLGPGYRVPGPGFGSGFRVPGAEGGEGSRVTGDEKSDGACTLLVRLPP